MEHSMDYQHEIYQISCYLNFHFFLLDGIRNCFKQMQFLMGKGHQINEHLGFSSLRSRYAKTSHLRIKQIVVEIVNKDIWRISVDGALLNHCFIFLDFCISNSKPSVFALDSDLNLGWFFFIIFVFFLFHFSYFSVGPGVILIKHIHHITFF